MMAPPTGGQRSAGAAGGTSLGVPLFMASLTRTSYEKSDCQRRQRRCQGPGDDGFQTQASDLGPSPARPAAQAKGSVATIPGTLWILVLLDPRFFSAYKAISWSAIRRAHLDLQPPSAYVQDHEFTEPESLAAWP